MHIALHKGLGDAGLAWFLLASNIVLPTSMLITGLIPKFTKLQY